MPKPGLGHIVWTATDSGDELCIVPLRRRVAESGAGDSEIPTTYDQQQRHRHHDTVPGTICADNPFKAFAEDRLPPYTDSGPSTSESCSFDSVFQAAAGQSSATSMTFLSFCTSKLLQQKEPDVFELMENFASFNT
eukprot:GFYU01005127.1.p1 GENE.GFYU01005127.1~~GFYU01005127.1.p1  ORF type:complete len:136 (+),score=8.96 GFYU01005127.1:459-866(+)